MQLNINCIQATRLEISPRRWEIRPARCSAILVYCSIRDFATSSDSKVSGFSVRTSDSLRIFFFHSGEQIQKHSDLLSWRSVDRNRIQKEKVADSKLSEYVWSGPKIVVLEAGEGVYSQLFPFAQRFDFNNKLFTIHKSELSHAFTKRNF